MIDIHSHLIFDVDDGVKNLEDSITVLQKLSKNGITDIVLTPHYIEYSSYTSNYKTNLEKLNIIKEELKKNNININVYLGNEIYINENIIELIMKYELTSLNKSKYLLIELPMSGEFPDFMEIFRELKNVGFEIILAHPERYIYFHKHYNELIEIHNAGIHFQVNLESLFGKYGNDSKKNIKSLLKDKLVDFVGTDIHRDKSDYSFISESKEIMKKYLTDEEIDNIFINNAKQNIIKC